MEWKEVFPTCLSAITYLFLDAGVVMKIQAWLERQRNSPCKVPFLGKDNHWRGAPKEAQTTLMFNVLENRGEL